MRAGRAALGALLCGLALAAPFLQGFGLKHLQLGQHVGQARARHQAAHADEGFHAGVVQPGGAAKAGAPLRAALDKQGEGVLVLGPEVKELRPGVVAGAADRDQAERGQGGVGVVVGVVGGRRVMVWWSGGQFTARKQARRLPQFFSLALTPQASM